MTPPVVVEEEEEELLEFGIRRQIETAEIISGFSLSSQGRRCKERAGTISAFSLAHGYEDVGERERGEEMRKGQIGRAHV